MEHEALLSRTDALLVVVDMQEKLLPAMADGDRVEHAARVLVEGLRLLDVPVLLTEQYPAGLGSTAASIAQAAGSAPRWAKTVFSAAQCEPFMDAVEDAGRDQVVLCGVEAHVCVLQTALDLSARGYQVHVAEDAIASRRPAHLANAVERMRREGVIVSNGESILFECLGEGRGDVFKRISALIK